MYQVTAKYSESSNEKLLQRISSLHNRMIFQSESSDEKFNLDRHHILRKQALKICFFILRDNEGNIHC